MATLVLSTVGTVLGGPVGGAIGALIGQSFDQELLGPKSPRVGDLKVQSSEYGTDIPRIYGTMRVAGTIVWATDLIAGDPVEGAKGQSGAVTSYSVSIAVALSARSAIGIGRIWADGRLLRGSAGDFKVETEFRFHPGGEGQEPDPLIASIEGIDRAPAYRGMAIAVFENLALAEYGNRIPFLTFELIGDPQPPVLGEVLADCSNGAIAATDSSPLGGFAAYGSTIRSAVAPLIEGFAIALFDDGKVVRSALSETPLAIDKEVLGNASNAEPAPVMEREFTDSSSLPDSLRLTYYDASRDYQVGEARARAGEGEGREESHQLPAVIESERAKGLAHWMIARRWARRDRLTLRLPPAMIAIEPGLRCVLKMSPGLWRVEAVAIDALVVIVELTPEVAEPMYIPADPGRISAAADAVLSDPSVALFEEPAGIGGDNGNEAAFFLAASSTSSQWRPASVTISAAGQTVVLPSANRKTRLGLVEEVPGPAGSQLRDEINTLTIALIDPDQWLENCDEDALVAGSNLAVAGSEYLQFARADPLGGGRYRLSGLLRGRLGTEFAAHNHQPGENFAMIDRRELTRVTLPGAAIGSDARFRLISDDRQARSVAVRGARLRPPAPVHLAATWLSGGDLGLSWIRRSRSGWAWIDDVDAPLGETRELYRISLIGDSGRIDSESAEPELVVAASSIAKLGGSVAEMRVRQIGDYGASPEAVLTISLSQGV